MNRSPTMPGVAAATLLAGVVGVVLAGCGGMKQTPPDDRAARPTTAIPDAQRVRVVIGNVTAGADTPEDVRESVCRYLRDLATAAVARQAAFILVNTNSADLLSGFGLASTQDTQTALGPEAAVDVDVLRLEEKLGATVKMVLASSQKKEAVARVRVTLRQLTGGENLTSVRDGKASKGAWGVITSVNRNAMKGGNEEWKLDGSMIGVACADAVRAGVADVGKRSMGSKREAAR